MSRILNIRTKHPKHRLHNDDFKEKLKEWWQEKGYSGRVFDRYMPLTGVEYRNTCYPIETMREQSQTFTQKNKTFKRIVYDELKSQIKWVLKDGIKLTVKEKCSILPPVSPSTIMGFVVTSIISSIV